MKRYIAYSLAILLIATGCKHDKDLFVNPNTPSTATPQTMLTEIEVATINSYEGDLNRTAGILVQHGVGVDGQATQTQVYSLIENQFDNQWGQLYQTLENCKQLNDRFGDANPRYKGINNILMAMNWGELTDLWGDIPFTEALQAQANYYPKYDAQQTVLQGIDKMLNDAITILSNTDNKGAIPASDDVIFNGSIDNWIKTAYTLKARYLNRYSNKSNYDPNAILAALSNGISSASEDCMGTHGSGANEQNQWYAFLNSRAYIVGAATLIDTMRNRGDLRVYYYFDSTGLGDVVGSPIDNTTNNASYWGQYLAGSPATPVPLVTYMEAKFIEAEVKVRKNDPTAAADLDTAIVESIKKVMGTRDSATAARIAHHTQANATLANVMFEKWIAMFGQLEAYNDYRRTKLPALTPNPSASISVIPQRYPTPLAERTANPNAPTPSITTPVWYAQ